MIFQPTFSLNHKIVNNLTESERLYGRLESMRLPQEQLLNLERNNLIKSSYVSNSIEGNPLTLLEVTNLLLGDRVPTNRDEKEVKNYFDLLKKLEYQVATPLSVEFIQTMHSQLMHGVDEKIAGQIRNAEVVIGGYELKENQPHLVIKHTPPFHKTQKITQALQGLVSWAEKIQTVPAILKAGIFHHQYVYIHPFEDGNGRTCRLLTALVFLKHNYQINKYFVLDDYYDVDRDAYSDALHTADFGDKTLWLEYFTDGIKYSLQSALSRVQSGVQHTRIQERLTPRQRDALEAMKKYPEVTSADLVRELQVSRQQVFNILKALIDKGYVEKKGITKRSYYCIKQ